MKTFKNLLVVAIVAITVMACKNEAKPEVKSVETESAAIASNELDPNANYAKAEFSIDGMTCAIGCAKTIEKKMAKMEGVKSAEVDFDRALAMVEYDEAKVTTMSLEETVKKSGDTYSVKDMKTVEAFSSEKSCGTDCKKACCAGKTDAEKMACAKDCKKACCAGKTDAEKKACAKDCKKACCAEENKA